MTQGRLITQFVVGYPKTVLIVFVAIAAIAGRYIPTLERDPTPYLLPATHESRVNLAKLRETYTGSNDSIIVLLESHSSVFNPKTLSRVQKLTEAFENIHLITDRDRDELLLLSRSAEPGIAEKLQQLARRPVDSETWMDIEEIQEMIQLSPEESREISTTLAAWTDKLSKVIEVTSLANTDNILGKDGKLDVNPIFGEVPQTKEALRRIEEDVLANELFDNILVSNGGKSTSIIIELAPMDDESEAHYQIYQQVKNIVEHDIPGDEAHFIAGLPVVTGALGKIMAEDTRKLFPIVLLIVVACLFVTFRRIKGIIVPLAVVMLSLVVTLGLKALFHISLNIITTTLPVFILSIGVADGIHMFSEYRDNLMKGMNKRQAVSDTVKRLSMPVMMTSFTTAVAFYAISLTQIVQLKHFGIFVAVGTLVAMLFSLFFIPAALLVLPEKKVTGNKPGSRLEPLYADGLIRLTGAFVRRPVLTASIASVIFAVSLLGASKVVVDNNNAKYFMKDSDIYISAEQLNQWAAGSTVLNLLVTSDTGDAEPFKKPDNLKFVDELVSFVKDQPKVGKVLGLTELIKRINLVMHEKNPACNVIPGTSTPDSGSGKARDHIISQLLLLYENGGGDTLSDLTDTGYAALNIPVVLQTNSSAAIHRFIEKVENFAALRFPGYLKLSFSGSANINVAATDEIVNGQMRSLIMSLGIVLVMLWLTFRKITYATISMIPLIMTIAVNFGIMGFFSIPLDIGTAIVSSIVIGIGVDYSIHYLSRLKKNFDQGLPFSEALDDTMRHSGKAISFNALTVGLGFVALLFSILTPLITMGWMIAVTMIVSAASTLVLLPVLILLLEKQAVLEGPAARHSRLAFNSRQHGF